MRKALVNVLILASIPGMLLLSPNPLLNFAGGTVLLVYAAVGIYTDVLWQHATYR